MSKALQPAAKYGRKETGPKALPTPTAPKTHNPCTRGGYMPFEHQYGDSAPEINPNNWQSIGDIAHKLAKAAGGDV